MGQLLYVLSDYIRFAMQKATYDTLEDESVAGKIAVCDGVLAFGNNHEDCKQHLQAALEGWLVVRLSLGHTLPVINGINLNNVR
jgi:predicted RNase H-like HicB family nuclease